MKLLEYMQLPATEQAKKRVSKSAHEKFSAMRSRLVSYLSGNEKVTADCDLLQALTADFTDGFRAFLDGSGLSESVAGEYFDTYRRAIRGAQRDGYLPPCDKWAVARYADASERSYGVTPYPYAAEFATLLRCFSEAPKSQRGRKSLEQREEDTLRRAAAMYLFGIFCYGTEPRELAALTLDGDKVTLPHYGCSLPLSDEARTLATEISGRPVSGGPLFEGLVLDGTEEAQALRYMRRHGVGLMKGMSVRADWLGIALSAGASVTQGALLAAGATGDAARDALMALGAVIRDPMALLTYRWYVLVSYKPHVRGADLLEMVKERRLLHNDKGARMWDPQYLQKVERRGQRVEVNSPAVSRFLFVRCKGGSTRELDTMIPEARLLRRREGGSTRAPYARIRESELVHLQRSLRESRREMVIVDYHRWCLENSVAMAAGQRVLVTNGPFAGYEGVVHKVHAPQREGESSRLIIRISASERLAIASRIDMEALSMDLRPLN